MKAKRLALLVFVTAVLTFSFSSAEVPQMINYQGRLTDSTGAPLDTSVSMRFRIYADSTTSTYLWSETHASISVEEGLFNVLLGSGTAIPDSVFNGNTRYLGIKVGSDSEMSPRRSLVSVGYAFHSEFADTAEYARAGTGGGIGGSGTANRIPKFTAPDTLGNSVIYESGGHVGIGTTSPTEKLDVAGTVRMTGFKMPAGASSGYVLTSDASGVGTWAPGGGGADNDWIISGNNMYAAVSGNVGIGTNTPQCRLHIQEFKGGGTAPTRVKVKGYKNPANPSDVGPSSYLLLGRSRGTPALDSTTWPGDTLGVVEGFGISPWAMEGVAARMVFLQVGESPDSLVPGAILFSTCDGNRISERMRIGSSGNVGIGNSAPSEKLDVNGDAIIRGHLDVDSIDALGTVQMMDFKMPAGATSGHILTSDASGRGTWQAPTGGGGDITAVWPGTGLSGGGSSGDVTLSVQVPLSLTGSSGGAIIGGSNTNTGSGKGVYGSAAGGSGIGVYGDASNSGDCINYGGYFLASGKHGRGVAGVATGSAAEGVCGEATGTSGVGVHGINGTGSNGVGVFGQAGYAGGMFSAGGSSGAGVSGSGTNAGSGAANYGGYFTAFGGLGTGVYGRIAGGPGSSGYAGYFFGNVQVTGTINKGAVGFKIDHPLDPENKYLCHSAVESPDMMNVYNGNVMLDGNGEAIVDLPDYFEALNRDFRYHLTAIGAPGPNLYIAEKIVNNRFGIAGGEPGMEVSWQVTGIRKDPFAQANRIQVEVDKPAGEQGKYLHPKAYGLGEEQGIHYEEHKRMEEQLQQKSVRKMEQR